MNWLSIFNEVFFLSWAIVVVVLLYRHALGGGAHIQRLHLLLNENTTKSVQSANEAAHAAHVAADAAIRAVEINARLVALLQEEHKDA